MDKIDKHFFAVLGVTLMIFIGWMTFALYMILQTGIQEGTSTTSIVAPEETILIPVKLTIHTTKGAMTYYPAPKSENEGDKLRYWFYPNDADIYAISVSVEKEGE